MKVLLLDPSISRPLQLPVRMGGGTFSDLFEVFLECGDLVTAFFAFSQILKAVTCHRTPKKTGALG
jgi:hypothetical protein